MIKSHLGILLLFLLLSTALQAQVSISYTPLPNVCNSNARTLIATITSPNGIPATGVNTPVLYYKVSSGPYYAIAGVKQTGDDWKFTFGSGFIPGQIISYFVIAADNAGNSAAFPSAGAATTVNPLQYSTEPASPNFYIVQNILNSGVYYVGRDMLPPNFITITDAVNAYNNSCLNGPVTFLLVDTHSGKDGISGNGLTYSTNEVFPIVIHNPQASATNTLTIKPVDSTGTSQAANYNKRFVVIRGTSGEALFKFNGADYVTISGYRPSATNPNTPYVYMYNDSEDVASTGVWIASNGTDAALNNTLKYLGIINKGPLKSFGGIIISNSNLPGQPSAVPNSNNTIDNNITYGSMYGIGVFGGASNDVNTVITNNTVGTNTVGLKSGFRGISVENQSNMNIEGNNVFGVESTVISGEPTAGIAALGNITGGKIGRNKVSDVKNLTATESQAVYGIAVYPSNANTGLRIQNNMVWNILSYGVKEMPERNAHGIAILSGSGYKIYHNSIHLTGAQTLLSGGLSSALFLGGDVSSSTSLDVRNNILSMRMTKGLRYSIYAVHTSPIIFANIDYNDYYTSGYVGYLAGQRNTLAEWQESTGQDNNSVAIDPKFVSNTDLHLQQSTPLESRGVGGLGVTVDIDNETRPVTPPKPDPGADEISPMPCSSNNGGTITSNRKDVCFTGAAILSAKDFSTGGGIDYKWQVSTDGTNFTNLAGILDPNIAYPPAITNDAYYRLQVTCNSGTPGYSNVIYMPVLKPAITSATANAQRCGSGTVNLSATAGPATGSPVVKWYDVPTMGTPLATSNNFTTPFLTANTQFYAEAQMGGTAGVVGPVSPLASGLSNVISSPSTFKVNFDVLAPTTLVSVDMFPAELNMNCTIGVFKSDGTPMVTVNFTTTVVGTAAAPVKQTVVLNVQLPVGQGYYLSDASGNGRFPGRGFFQNQGGASYPYNSSDIRITDNAWGPAAYLYYYNLKFSSACPSPRKVVPVTINPPPAITITATADSICSGGSTTLKVTSPNSNYIYSWMPGNRVGSSITVSPTINTIYTVKANDGVCGTTGAIKVNIKAMPEPVFVHADTIKCFEQPAIKLDATGGSVRGEVILQEDFNLPLTPYTSGSTTTWLRSPSSGVSSFQQLPAGSPLFSMATFSNDSTTFIGLNGDTRSNISAMIRTPKLNMAAFSTVTMTFYYRWDGFPSDIFDVQVWSKPTGNPANTFDDTDWTTVWNSAIKYLYAPFFKATIDLSAYAGKSNVYVRFRYKTYDGFLAAFDNVLITGNDLAPSFTWGPATGLFTDAAGTIPYTGGVSPVVYAAPDSTRTFTVSSTGITGCSSSSTARVRIRETAGDISGDNTICGGGSSNITVKLFGNAPWSITYTDGTTSTTINNITDPVYTITVSPLVASVYTLTAVSDANCSARPSKITGSATISFTSPGVSSWVGVNTNWFDQANWCGFVPDATTKVIIPTGSTAYPEIDGIAAAKEISVATNAKLTIKGNGSLSVKEAFANNGTFKNNGALILDGTALQVFPTGNGTITDMNILDINNTVGVTLNKKMRITGKLRPRAGTITVTDTIFIASTFDSTASITKAGSQFVYTGNGKFTVERFIPDHRKAWQLLSAATFGQSIREAWMEGATYPLQNLKPGYGTITTSELPNALVQGFDIYTPLGSTVKVYNPATNGWDGVPTVNNAVSQPNGYLIYVRGDRSVTDAVTPANNVILRSTGKIYSPTNPAPDVSVATGRFQSIGNPYACAIDFTDVRTISTNVDAKFYVWDPVLTGSSGNGGYQTISAVNGWKPVPGSSKYPSTIPVTTIESGQAFIVYSTSGGTVRFSENNKVEGSNMRFRPEGGGSFLRGWLYSGATVMDGNVIAFSDDYSNNYDADDALKMSSSTQSFGIKSAGKIMAVEARKHVVTTDTVFYSMKNMKTGNYRFEFSEENLDPFITAKLIDNFTGIETPLQLNGTTTYDFSISNTSGSNAEGRFIIVFGPARPLPVTILNVEAVKQQNSVQVKWTVANEVNVENYDVLHSVDGINFIAINSTDANGGPVYTFTHLSPVAGYNYYRIRSKDISGEVKYSDIVKVKFELPYVINVYPNPVTGSNLNVKISGIASGRIKMMLINNLGQPVWQKIHEHIGSTDLITIPVGGLPSGNYKLIISGEGMKEVVSVVVSD